jgi:methyl-accepting chemotaxis protein
MTLCIPATDLPHPFADMQGRAMAAPIRGVEMDFDEAVGTHSKWKRKLRHVLAKRDGSLHPSEISLDHKCVLGQWIYGEGAIYSSLPEYTRLKYEHSRFHLVAAELVKKANSGEFVGAEMTPCANTEFSTASSAVVIAIMAMKKRLSE